MRRLRLFGLVLIAIALVIFFYVGFNTYGLVHFNTTYDDVLMGMAILLGIISGALFGIDKQNETKQSPSQNVPVPS